MNARDIRYSSWLMMGLLVTCVWFGGCSETKSPPVAKSSSSTEEDTVQATDLQDGRPATPEAAMQQMVEGLKVNRPVVIWQAMPEAFQREVNGLIREFARKMDPALWKQSFATWEKLARLLADKKTEILTHPALTDLTAEQRQRLESHWDGLVELLTILVHSELANLKQVESFEMGRFLEQTGGKWLSQLASLSESLGQDSLSGMLTGLTPKTISLKDDKAVMAWMAAGSDVPVSQFDLIHVEGRWIPAGWVTAWEQIRDWRGQLRNIPAEAFTQQSGEKLKSLAVADRIMEKLLATTSPEEFQETLANELGQPTVNEMAALIRLLAGSGPQSPVAEMPTETVPPATSNPGIVTLLLTGNTTANDEDRIFDAIQAALPGDVEVQFEQTAAGLKIIVGPVADFEQFQKSITFAEILKVDANTRTLQVQLKR